MTITPPACGLDAATLERLRAEAFRDASPFTDPAIFRKAEQLLPSVGTEWLDAVTGRPVMRWTRLSPAEMALAVAAAEADADHLAALAREREAAQRAHRQQAAGTARRLKREEREAWETLRGRLPVPVAVWHNWTARHLDGYEQGADHIVVTGPEGLHAGRLHRLQGQSLCWIPSRARELRHVSPSVGDETRIPTCNACLIEAHKLAARQRGK